MPYVNGYNMSGYSPHPESLHVTATLADAREDHAYTLSRWADECCDVVTDHADERDDLESISAELTADAENATNVRDGWLTEDAGGSISTRGPDGNGYTFWSEHKTYAELISDGWSVSDLDDAGIYPEGLPTLHADVDGRYYVQAGESTFYVKSSTLAPHVTIADAYDACDRMTDPDGSQLS